MPAGRPRTVSLPPNEMILLGDEMIEWVSKNDPVHLSEFYCILKGYTDSEWDTMHVAPEFFPYYERALKIIGIKYLKKDSNIDPGIKQRWQRVYFKDLKREEDEQVKYNESVKSATVQTGDTYISYPSHSAAYIHGQVPAETLSKEHS